MFTDSQHKAQEIADETLVLRYPDVETASTHVSVLFFRFQNQPHHLTYLTTRRKLTGCGVLPLNYVAPSVLMRGGFTSAINVDHRVVALSGTGRERKRSATKAQERQNGKRTNGANRLHTYAHKPVFTNEDVHRNIEMCASPASLVRQASSYLATSVIPPSLETFVHLPRFADATAYSCVHTLTH